MPNLKKQTPRQRANMTYMMVTCPRKFPRCDVESAQPEGADE